MNPAEIAAYIGAAAWLPQIISWAYKSYSKPSLKLITSPTFQLGYTTLGPIINLTCSISAETRDALIEKIEIILKHEKGEKRTMTWSLLYEKQQEITNYMGERAEIAKNQPAIALKVPTISLTEKQITFQDLEFQADFQLHSNKIMEIYNFHKKKGKSTEEIAKTIFETKEYSDFNDSFTRFMYWKPGNYDIDVIVKEIRLKNPHIEKFSFKLTENDAERLIENCNNLENEIKFYIVKPSDVDSEEYKVHWNWIYPKIFKQD